MSLRMGGIDEGIEVKNGQEKYNVKLGIREWKRYSEYKDSGVEWIGKIPKKWKLLPIRRVVDKFVDYRGATPKKVPNGIPLITAKNIKNDKIDFSLSQEFIPEEDYNEWMVRGFPEIGDILVTTEAPLGESAQIIDTNIALAQRIILLKANKNQITNDYFKYHFSSKSGTWELLSRATGSTALGIKASKLKETLVTLPPITEQEKIIFFLDRETSKIDTLIEKKQRLIELLQEKRSALISHAVTKGLDPNIKMKDSGVEWIGKIPNGWGIRKLSHIAEGINVGFVGPIEKYYTDESGILLLKTGNIGFNKVLLNEVSYVTREFHELNSKSKLLPGDIIIARHGESGKAAVIPEEIMEANCLNVVVLRKSKLMNGRYYANLLNCSLYQQYLKSSQGGSVQGVINTSDISQLHVIYPPISEQQLIVNFLDHETEKIDTFINKISAQIEKLKEYRTALISAAVTGKIDVREEVA